MPSYKILSFDGGGSWAILQALALGQLFGAAVPGRDILEKFDLVAANSGGSIVLALLAVNKTPQQIFDTLNNEAIRKTIFVRNFPSIVLFDFEKYDAAAKLVGLRNALNQGPWRAGTAGNLSLTGLELKTKLLISTFNYDRQRSEFFRSDANSPAVSVPGGSQPTLAEAVHASSNAPLKYFDKPAQFSTPAFQGNRYWDGAIGGYNNPVLAAVTEALAYGVAGTDLRILTLGNGGVCLPMPNPIPAPDTPNQNALEVKILGSNFWHDLPVLAGVIADDPPDQASYVAHLISIGGGAGSFSADPEKPMSTGNLVRLNASIQPHKIDHGWAVPNLIQYLHAGSPAQHKYPSNESAFSALVKLDMDAIEQDEVDLITMLGKSWIAGDAPNQAVRSSRDLKTLIGHSTFAQGLAQATSLGLVP